MTSRDHHATAPQNFDEAGAAVIAFRRKGAASMLAAQVLVSADDRPVRPVQQPSSPVSVLLLLGSVAVHAGLIAAFGAAPRSLSSAGIPAISVDIVLGDNAAAGLASAPGQESATEVAPTETAQAETPVAEPDPVKPLAVAEAALPAALELAQPAAATPPMLPPEVIPPAPAQLRPDAVPARQLPAVGEPPRSVASSAASGISRGGSAADANYHGLVAAHLARHKQFPVDARRRGEHGSVGIDFRIDGGGRVTSVRIARSSRYASLDQAAEAMVWRASPFPAPPDHQPQRFSVPVSYSIR